RRPAVVESTPPLMPSTRVLSPALCRHCLMNALRRSISASSWLRSANGGTTCKAAAISVWRSVMLMSSVRLADAKDVFQVGDELFVAALGLARGIGDLRHRLTIAGGHLDDDVHRFDTGNVAGQVGADAETRVDPPLQGAVQLETLAKSQTIGKHQCLAARIDSQRLVVGDGLLGPGEGVARIVAQTVEE